MIQPLLLDTLFAVGTLTLMCAFVVYQVSQVRWLTSHGRQISAVVTSIRHETGKTTWGIARDHYYLTATWTDPRTGRTYTFWTWIMNSKPSYTKGSLVPVLIDPNNPKRFALNLSEGFGRWYIGSYAKRSCHRRSLAQRIGSPIKRNLSLYFQTPVSQT